MKRPVTTAPALTPVNLLLRWAREQKAYTPEQAAAACGLTAAQYEALENGAALTPVTAAALSRALGVPARYLMLSAVQLALLRTSHHLIDLQAAMPHE